MKTRQLICLATILLLAACVSPPQTAALRQQAPADFSEAVLLPDIPFFPQDEWQCGPAALATVLQTTGVDVVPAELVPLVYVPERKGSFQVEMTAAARSHGRLAYELNPTLTALFTEVEAGHAVLVLQNLGIKLYPRWHFAVVKGFDLATRTVVMNSGVHENYETALATFERTWARAQHWGLVIVEPGTVPATAEPGAYFAAVAALEETQPDAALEAAYSAGLRRWPEDRELLMAFGNVLYARGALEAAAQQFARVQALYPDYAPAWNNRAQVLFELGDIAQALPDARKAVELGGPFSATYQATLREISASVR